MNTENKNTMTEWEAEERYEELLNESHDLVFIAGYGYATGTALKKLDPVAFRRGMLDWLDAEGIELTEPGQPVTE